MATSRWHAWVHVIGVASVPRLHGVDRLVLTGAGVTLLRSLCCHSEAKGDVL